MKEGDLLVVGTRMCAGWGARGGRGRREGVVDERLGRVRLMKEGEVSVVFKRVE